MSLNRHAIAAMGTALGPDVLERCRALFDADQLALAARVPAQASDIAYGPDDRHRLDIYGSGAGLPVLLFVHGGGFVMGDKGGAFKDRREAESWANAAVGRLAAESGFIGAVMNYRLAPDHVWPAGSQDVGAAITWLRGNVADHGGDPARIVVVGTSAGAVHIAGWLRLDPDHRASVRGAVLLSGLYGFTPADPKDLRYYGEAALYPQRMPRDAVAETALPLLIACAEYDPPRFQAEFLGLMEARLARHGTMPRGYLASGHNHYSMAMHLGTPDRRLAEEIFCFIKDVTA